MDVWELIWIAAVVAVSSFAQTLSGFGFALLSVPLMSLFVAPHDAVIISTAVAMVSTSVQAVIDRRHAQWDTAKRLILASFVGMPFGLLIFIFVSESVMRAVLGVVVIGAVIVLFRGFSLQENNRLLDWVFGVLSGVLATSLSTNGPPLVFLMQARKFSPDEFRATINSVFAIVGIASFALFVGAGKVESSAIVGVLIGIPVLGIGVSSGYFIRRHLHGDRFRRLVLVLLLASGCSALVGSITR